MQFCERESYELFNTVATYVHVISLFFMPHPQLSMIKKKKFVSNYIYNYLVPYKSDSVEYKDIKG